MVSEYRHEPFTDFSKEENKAAFEEALRLVNSQLGKQYPLVIGGDRIMTEELIVSTNPASKKEVIGEVAKADRYLANLAVESAFQAFQTWKSRDAEERAVIGLKAAKIIRDRKQEYSVFLVRVAEKS